MGLVSRLVVLTGPCGDNPLDLFGDFICWIPSLIARSDVVFATACSLVDGLVTFPQRNGKNIAVSRASNGKALHRIRTALLSNGTKDPGSDLLMAVRMMYLIEVCLHVVWRF